jgi:heterotetrameric sarcosine oxidase gamma subunit
VPEAVRAYAFDACAAGAENSTVVAPGVTIAERRPRSMLNVRGDPADAGLASALRESFNVTLPLEPNTVTAAGATRALWLGPDEWLLVSERRALQPPASPGRGTLTDLSHGRAVLRLSGADVRAVLAKGCGLDLHPREFPVDRCAQTAIAKVSVILDHVQLDVFDLYCPRSYARSFWGWVTEACAEYGCRIAPPAS